MSPSTSIDDHLSTIRNVVDGCADCDTCRFLMDENCLLFPELYRLYDQETEHGQEVSHQELRKLMERCTLCGLCPCPDVPLQIIQSKRERIQAQGMPLPIRLLADVQRFGRLSALGPKAFNHILAFKPIRHLARKAAGIHPQRSLPHLPDEHFFAWAKRHRLDQKPDAQRKVAYFVGCTAGYLFPQVARAAVTVLQHSGTAVYVPSQKCCGMPTFVEGDDQTTLRRIRFNLNTLMASIREGFDIVCSCPTCGFLMKVLLKYRAYYSETYQRHIGAGPDEIKIPDEQYGKANGFIRMKKSMYETILKDDSFFSRLDPLERIALAENVMDLGLYLERLDEKSISDQMFGPLHGRMVYYAPCHQRQQGIGSPYLKLLKKIPGLQVISVGSSLDCCGMGGSLGFKQDFYQDSIQIATPLVKKIQAATPEAIITDCLSCRIQFQHLLPFPVHHPLEVIAASFRNLK